MAVNWYDRAVSCKIGTMPALVHVHGADRIEPERYIRVKERPGDRWRKVLVRSVNRDGYFFADR